MSKGGRPLVVGGNELRDEVNFELDADTRMLTVRAREALAIEPVTMSLPWAVLKQTVAQIMVFECDQMTGAVAGKQQLAADYFRVKKQVAFAMLREAQAEIAAAKGETPADAPPPAAPGFDAGAG